LHRFCLIHPCDRRTDRRTDGQTELRWLRRAIAVPAVARKTVYHILLMCIAAINSHMNFIVLWRVTLDYFCSFVPPRTKFSRRHCSYAITRG